MSDGDGAIPKAMPNFLGRPLALTTDLLGAVANGFARVSHRTPEIARGPADAFITARRRWERKRAQN